jgi:hypothetical protein
VVFFVCYTSFILVCARLSDRKKREEKGGFLWVGFDRIFSFGEGGLGTSFPCQIVVGESYRVGLGWFVGK